MSLRKQTRWLFLKNILVWDRHQFCDPYVRFTILGSGIFSVSAVSVIKCIVLSECNMCRLLIFRYRVRRPQPTLTQHLHKLLKPSQQKSGSHCLVLLQEVTVKLLLSWVSREQRTWKNKSRTVPDGGWDCSLLRLCQWWWNSGQNISELLFDF